MKRSALRLLKVKEKAEIDQEMVGLRTFWKDMGQGLRTYGARAQNGKKGKISLTRDIRCCPTLILFLLPDHLCHIVNNICIYTHIWLCTGCIWTTVATKWQCSETFYTNRSAAMCWLDNFRWGDSLTVTGPIRDIGQNVVQTSFEQEAAAALFDIHVQPS
jgi:hypothetical protein